MQKVLTFFTKNDKLRSQADGWDWENGDLAHCNINKEIGFIPCGSEWLPPTPLHALGDGWKLLGPPVKQDEQVAEVTGYEYNFKWWFVKD